MSRITVGQLEVNDGPNGIKKLQVHIQTRFQVDCDCDQISVKIYWHAESAGGTIISPSGTSSTGDTTDPQGVPWEWTPGQDGWVTDSVDTNPQWNSWECKSGSNGNIVTVADRPGIGIPPGSQGPGYSYTYKVTWKIDVLCNGQVIDHEYYRLTITGNGSNSGPTPGNLYGETEQAAVDEINQKMRDNGSYSVDAEGNPW